MTVSGKDKVIERLIEAAVDLYERVEMDESVGICLSDRTPSLRFDAAYAEYRALAEVDHGA